jgi:nucleoside-diphosphate kinase
MIERTLVILKPDAVKRKLAGKIITVLEEAGFDIVEAKFFRAEKSLLDRHYPNNNKWFASVGEKAIANYKDQGMDIKSVHGTDNPVEVGKIIKKWLVEYMTDGPVMAMLLQGNGAIRNIRKLCGNTIPMNAEPSTIRGRFSLDSSDLADSEHRSLRNLMHASGNSEEAKFEIELWFGHGKSEVKQAENA